MPTRPTMTASSSVRAFWPRPGPTTANPTHHRMTPRSCRDGWRRVPQHLRRPTCRTASNSGITIIADQIFDEPCGIDDVNFLVRSFARTQENRIRRSSRRYRQPAGSRSHPRAHAARGMALGARRRDGGHDPALYQPAILVAVLYRLHPAQHRIFLSADRADAAVHIPDLSRHRDRSARPHSLVRHHPVRTDVWRLDLADAQHPKSGAIGLGIRRRPQKRHRSRPRDVVRADGGAAADRRLEPADERAAVHRLSAVRGSQLARTLQGLAAYP